MILQELRGHAPESFGRSKYRCILCLQTWATNQRREVASWGPCPGARIWGEIDTRHPNLRPALAQRGISFAINGKQLHPSHHFATHRGIVWCWKCGFYTTGRQVVKLTASSSVPTTTWLLLCSRRCIWIPPLDFQTWSSFFVPPRSLVFCKEFLPQVISILHEGRFYACYDSFDHLVRCSPFIDSCHKRDNPHCSSC